jgi:hypothetical protein
MKSENLAKSYDTCCITFESEKERRILNWMQDARRQIRFPGSCFLPMDTSRFIIFCDWRGHSIRRNSVATDNHQMYSGYISSDRSDDKIHSGYWCPWDSCTSDAIGKYVSEVLCWLVIRWHRAGLSQYLRWRRTRPTLLIPGIEPISRVSESFSKSDWPNLIDPDAQIDPRQTGEGYSTSLWRVSQCTRFILLPVALLMHYNCIVTGYDIRICVNSAFLLHHLINSGAQIGSHVWIIAAFSWLECSIG